MDSPAGKQPFKNSCVECRKAKRRCEGEIPCQRCRKKGLECALHTRGPGRKRGCPGISTLDRPSGPYPPPPSVRRRSAADNSRHNRHNSDDGGDDDDAAAIGRGGGASTTAINGVGEGNLYAGVTTAVACANKRARRDDDDDDAKAVQHVDRPLQGPDPINTVTAIISSHIVSAVCQTRTMDRVKLASILAGVLQWNRLFGRDCVRYFRDVLTWAVDALRHQTDMSPQALQFAKRIDKMDAQVVQQLTEEDGSCWIKVTYNGKERVELTTSRRMDEMFMSAAEVLEFCTQTGLTHVYVWSRLLEPQSIAAFFEPLNRLAYDTGVHGRQDAIVTCITRDNRRVRCVASIGRRVDASTRSSTLVMRLWPLAPTASSLLPPPLDDGGFKLRGEGQLGLPGPWTQQWQGQAQGVLPPLSLSSSEQEQLLVPTPSLPQLYQHHHHHMLLSPPPPLPPPQPRHLLPPAPPPPSSPPPPTHAGAACGRTLTTHAATHTRDVLSLVIGEAASPRAAYASASLDDAALPSPLDLGCPLSPLHPRENTVNAHTSSFASSAAPRASSCGLSPLTSTPISTAGGGSITTAPTSTPATSALTGGRSAPSTSAAQAARAVCGEAEGVQGWAGGDGGTDARVSQRTDGGGSGVTRVSRGGDGGQGDDEPTEDKGRTPEQQQQQQQNMPDSCPLSAVARGTLTPTRKQYAASASSPSSSSSSPASQHAPPVSRDGTSAMLKHPSPSSSTPARPLPPFTDAPSPARGGTKICLTRACMPSAHAQQHMTESQLASGDVEVGSRGAVAEIGEDVSKPSPRAKRGGTTGVRVEGRLGNGQVSCIFGTRGSTGWQQQQRQAHDVVIPQTHQRQDPHQQQQQQQLPSFPSTTALAHTPAAATHDAMSAITRAYVPPSSMGLSGGYDGGTVGGGGGGAARTISDTFSEYASGSHGLGAPPAVQTCMHTTYMSVAQTKTVWSSSQDPNRPCFDAPSSAPLPWHWPWHTEKHGDVGGVSSMAEESTTVTHSTQSYMGQQPPVAWRGGRDVYEGSSAAVIRWRDAPCAGQPSDAVMYGGVNRGCAGGGGAGGGTGGGGDDVRDDDDDDDRGGGGDDDAVGGGGVSMWGHLRTGKADAPTTTLAGPYTPASPTFHPPTPRPDDRFPPMSSLALQPPLSGETGHMPSVAPPVLPPPALPPTTTITNPPHPTAHAPSSTDHRDTTLWDDVAHLLLGDAHTCDLQQPVAAVDGLGGMGMTCRGVHTSRYHACT